MIFRRAILRLTLAYTAIQLVLFGAFAIGIYTFVTLTFDFDVPGIDGAAAVSAAELGFANLRTGLIVGYLILVVLVPGASYLMARAALTPLRKSYEQQQNFVDGASHEFRSPLSVIQGELELALSRPRTPREYRAAITRSLEATQGLTRLTDDLLLLTRDGSAELEATYEPVPLSELARRVTEQHALPDSGKPAVTLELGADVAVWGSQGLLARALGNLIDNARKFTPATGSVTVATSVQPGFAVIEVRDTGIGMTEAERRRAFDRFWRAEEARSKPGHGVGLALVHQICAAHHGRVSLTSTPGHGTSVTMSLPDHPLDPAVRVAR